MEKINDLFNCRWNYLFLDEDFLGTDILLGIKRYIIAFFRKYDGLIEEIGGENQPYCSPNLI